MSDKAEIYADQVSFSLDADPRIKAWACDLLHAAFTDFAEGRWSLAVLAPHALEWWQQSGDEYVDLSVTPNVLVEAFAARIHADEPIHPEDHAAYKDAATQWRQAIEQIERRLAEARIKDIEAQS